MSAASPSSPRAPKAIYGRDAYIPEWQTDLTPDELAKQVTQNGEPLGFTIGEMLPERQWAVNAKTGELLKESDFERLYEVFASRHVPAGTDRVVDIRQNNKYFDAKLVPMPNVRHFASRGLDWQGKEVAIGYDPDVSPTATEDEIKIYNARGEVVTGANAPRAVDITRQLEVLTGLRERGKLSDAEFAEEVASLSTGAATAPAVEAIPVGFTSLGITAEAAAEEVTARCGKVCGSKAGRAAHERGKCETCNPTPEFGDAA